MTRECNKKIAIAALLGETYSSIGKQYGLTRECIRYIVHRECELADSKKYHSIVGFACASNVVGLRRCRNHFVREISRRLQKSS